MTGSSKANAGDLDTKRTEIGTTGGTNAGGQANQSRIGVMTYFWWTIVTLISVTLALSVMAIVNQPRSATGVLSPEPPDTAPDGEEEVELPAGCLPVEDLRRRAEGRTAPLLEYLLRRPLPETGEAIRDNIDSAFEPVYERIPTLLDWHYSVAGQYTELGLAAAGRLQQEMESRLFRGIDERMDEASTAIDGVLGTELSDSIEQWLRNESQSVDPDCDARLVYVDMLGAVIPDSMQRFRTLVVPAGVTALGGAAAGKAAVTALIKSMSKKLVASTAAKAVGKMVPKLLGKWGGAAAGGTVGTALGVALGPVGAIVGGVVGVAAGAAGWLIVDGVVMKADEHLNRADLERELTELVDQRRAAIKESISTAFEEARLEALERVTPFELSNPD